MRLLFITVLLFSVVHVFGQGENNSLKGVPAKERIVFGGGMGLSFGAQQDFVSVSPVLGYMFTKRLIGGTGVTYRYTNYKFLRPNVQLHDYGVNPYVQFFVYRNIFLQTEYEYLNYEFPVPTSGRTETIRQDFTSFLAGAGFLQPLGKNLGFYLLVLYNFSYVTPQPGQYTPYNSPFVIRAGINIGRFSFF
jgi:hypothetical protein